MPPIWTDGDPSASPDVNASELMQNLIMNDDDKEWYEELFKKNHKSFLKPRFSVQPGGNACLSCSFIRVSNAVLAENGADHRVDTYGVFIPVPPSVVRGLEAAYPAVVRNQSHDDSPLHVTVLYVGQLDDLQAQAMRNACLDVLDHIQPFDVSVQGTSHFDNAGSSVFHACVVSPALENLHHTLKAALQTAGIPVEHRYGDNPCGSFKGHITLAMLPPGQHEKELPLCGSWVVDRVEVWNMGSPVSMRLGMQTCLACVAGMCKQHVHVEGADRNMKRETLERFIRLVIETGKKKRVLKEPDDIDEKDATKPKKNEFNSVGGGAISGYTLPLGMSNQKKRTRRARRKNAKLNAKCFGNGAIVGKL